MEKIEISRSSLFMILKTLKNIGYIDQSEKRGRYIAGPRMISWGLGSQSQNAAMDLLASFYNEAESITLAETFAIVVKGDAGDCVVLGQTESEKDVRCVFTAGQKISGQSGAGIILGKQAPLETKKNGFVKASRGESVDVAVPICTNGGSPDAVLLYSCPSYREAEQITEEAISSLREMAARISYRCGAQFYSPWKDEISHGVGETLSMTANQVDALLRSPWMARLACVKPDGSPHVVPVWFEWNNGKINVLAWKGSKWADYIIDNPQISLTIDEPWKPFRRISINGTASAFVGAAPSVFTDLVNRMGERYLGNEQNQTLVAQVETAFSISISYIKGWKGI
jgi:DNA-binding IclR family transcriptional regulator